MSRPLSSDCGAEIRRLFDTLAEVDAAERPERLAQLCPERPDLRQEVEALLEAYGRADAVLTGLTQLRPLPPSPEASDASDPHQLVGRTISHYQVLEHLGGGGMGVVYKACDTKLGRLVALKFLPSHLGFDEEAKRRFVREAKAASALDHVNIGTTYEIGEAEDGRLFIAMACYEGETLKKKIQWGPLEVEEALGYATQIAEGLSRAHAAGIVHRDIKPANVLVTEEGTAKLLDFGIAKMVGTDVTEEGAALGTAPYMSPEQARGKTVDHRTDLWSLGVVLYELLTGEQPFRSDNHQAVIYSILHEEPEPAKALRPEVPEQLERVVEKLLRKNPAERYQQADEVLADLQALHPARATALQDAGTPRPVRYRYQWVGVGALVLVLLGLGLSLWWQASGPEAASVGLATTAQLGASPPSLAVLPLKNNSGDPEQGYFAAGMTEALLAELSKVEALRVISLMRHEEVDKSLPELLEELGVEVVLEGGVVSHGEHVGITARLTEVGTNDVLWSERFEEELRNVVTLQREVALAVAQEVAGTLTPQEEARLATAQAVDEEAVRLYLKGIQVRHDNDDPQAAAPYFEEAVEKDPDFASAWAWLANLSAICGNEARAEQAVEKALTLDPSLSEAYVALGLIREFSWDWTGAEQAFRHAVELSPGDAEAHHELGQLLMRRGQFAEALTENERALQANPLAPRFQTGVGEVYFYGRQYDEALEVFEEITEQFPEFFNAHWYTGHIYLLKGMTEQAIKQFEEWGHPGDLGMAHAAAGRSAEAWAVHKSLAELPWDRHKGTSPFNLIDIPAALGDKETALDWLERAHDQRLGLLVYLKVWHLFDPLRSEPRFQAVLWKMGLDA